MTSLRSRIGSMLLTAALSAAPAGAAYPQDGRSVAVYSVRYLGFPIAHVSFVTRTKGGSYTNSGSLRSAGLVEIIDKTRGTTRVSGTIKGDRMQASSYVISYTSGDKHERTEVTFRNGNVQSARQIPKPKKRGKDWIPVGKEDLKSVLDPISGMILPAGSDICPRTLPIFDGETRVDLLLAPKGRVTFSAGELRGEAIACSVRFVPKAGYRKGNDSIDFLRSATDMEVWFARSPSADVYAPVYARVPTKIGPVTVRATRFGR
jgi:hypothetical protein